MYHGRFAVDAKNIHHAAAFGGGLHVKFYAPVFGCPLACLAVFVRDTKIRNRQVKQNKKNKKEKNGFEQRGGHF
jgi:hypothetical protein